jgi:hypothetical protein
MARERAAVFYKSHPRRQMSTNEYEFGEVAQLKLLALLVRNPDQAMNLISSNVGRGVGEPKQACLIRIVIRMKK